MAGKRLLYLAVLTLCGIFYIAYGQWLSWIILVTVLALPWFSLFLSLPAILRFQASPSGPAVLELGDRDELWLMGSCPLPMPPFRGRLRLTRILSGESWFYQDPEDLRTDHCGGVSITVESAKICDYLGLFSFPIRTRDTKTILVRPQPISMNLEQELQRFIARSWKPKSGGGYAENHELRLYRPGDSLNQVHWKLSAKTGSLVIREAMEPQQGLILLTMNLRGTPEELDRKLGRFLWLGQCLAGQNVRFEARVLTGNGLLTFSIGTQPELDRALSTLLCSKTAGDGDLRTRTYPASWHCHIGGEPDEA